MYQWNFNIKLQFTNFSLFISDADFQSKSNNWIPWSRSTILYLILILILIFILGETRDRGSVWSLDQHLQQQQQPRICMDIASYYGIVSYAVGVSLILSIAGIKTGRRFFHLFNRRRRHAARHADQQIVENGDDERVNHRRRPPPRDQEPLDLMMGGLELANRVFTDNQNPEVIGQESGWCSTSRFWVSSHALEGQKWFDQISCQWESQKNLFAMIYFGKIQFFYLPEFKISRSCPHWYIDTLIHWYTL